MSNGIYIPYFYIIQDVRNGMYYAGSKWGAGANPASLMIEDGYTTSSETIKELTKQYGINNFKIRKIRIFKTAPEAHRYETRFLRRINARKHPKFYNGHNNDGAMNIFKMQILMKELYGVENPFQSKEIKNRSKKTNLRKYGVEYYTQSEEYKKSYHETCIEKYGVPFHTQSESTKEAQKRTNLQIRGVENPSHCPEVLKKISIGIKKTKSTEEWKSTKGREQSDRNRNLFTGKTNITDGITTRWFNPTTEVLPDGWRLGKAEQIRQKGRICINDGNQNKFIHPNENIPEGWIKGRKRETKF